MRNDQDALDIRTERLANETAINPILASQTGTAQADRTEIIQVISSAGVSSLTGTANQITVSAPTGNVTVSLPSTITVVTAYQVNGTQVMGTQKTGWTAWTGTNDRGTHATYSGTASAGYVQAELQAVMDSLKQITEAFKALQADLLSHGMIGS